MTRRARLLAVALLVLAAGAGASAVRYIAFEQIAVANTAIGFTVANITPNGLTGTGLGDNSQQVSVVQCRVRGAELSYRYDGGTPTTTVGQLLEVGDIVVVTGHDSVTRFLAIRTTAVSGQLDCFEWAP
jgi:hypothetical protein